MELLARNLRERKRCSFRIFLQLGGKRSRAGIITHAQGKIFLLSHNTDLTYISIHILEILGNDKRSFYIFYRHKP